MNNKFKYKFQDNILIIEKCPNNILTKEMIENFQNVESVYLREGIEEIDDNAFAKFYNLKRIHLPKSLIAIGSEVFSNCRNLSKIRIPDGVRLIGCEAFELCEKLEEIKLSNSLKEIERGLFSQCVNLSKITIPEGVKIIGDGAFLRCKALNNVSLPDTLEIIGNRSFEDCFELKYVLLPRSIKEIGGYAFYHCWNLENVDIPNTVVEIREGTFSGCEKLKSIILPKNVKNIGYEAFNNCVNLKNIEIPEGIEIIENGTFDGCTDLESIILPSTLKTISDSSFAECYNLKNINIPSGVTYIGSEAFSYCEDLEHIRLPNTLKTIGSYAFETCLNLKAINIPDSVTIIKEGAFMDCNMLKEIKLSNNIEEIDCNMFNSCINLEKIEIPEGVKVIRCRAFTFGGDAIINEISLPSTLQVFENDVYDFDTCYFDKLILNTNMGKIEINVKYFEIISNRSNILYLYDTKKDEYSFFYNGEYIKFNKDIFMDKPFIKKSILKNEIDRSDYFKLYYWKNKDFVPGATVIKNMPISDVDNFYVNNNCKEWERLIKKCNFSFEPNKSSFFKICYVLGVFSSNASFRDKAVSFIVNNIIGKMSEFEMHRKFEGLDLNIGFNEEYAEFFMKYYSDDFMKYVDKSNREIDLIASSYNNFSNVKKLYPNKTIHTNRRVDLLLPEHVIYAIKNPGYSNIELGNEELASIIGNYGYSESQFSLLQQWFDISKSIKEEEKKLFISEDSEKEKITYELLSKDNPLGAVLGNISNCCQVLGGAGESCVKYGMTMPNSSFMIFKYKNKIIGQAWVWYDEKSKVICLDNIEIPNKYFENMKHNESIKRSFVDCLKRVRDSFIKEMNNRGLIVEKVTVGRGYNSLMGILDNEFNILKSSQKLNQYFGYSDANEQYDLGSLKKMIFKSI